MRECICIVWVPIYTYWDNDDNPAYAYPIYLHPIRA